jgi:hypothetical protein
LRAIIKTGERLRIKTGIKTGITIGADRVQLVAVMSVHARTEAGDFELQIAIDVNNDGAGGNRLDGLRLRATGHDERRAHGGH